MTHKNINSSLISIFIPYTKENENKLTSIMEIYDLKDQKLEENIGVLKATNKVTKVDETLPNKFNLQAKKVTIKHNKYQKSFYSFSLD